MPSVIKFIEDNNFDLSRTKDLKDVQFFIKTLSENQSKSDLVMQPTPADPFGILSRTVARDAKGSKGSGFNLPKIAPRTQTSILEFEKQLGFEPTPEISKMFENGGRLILASKPGQNTPKLVLKMPNGDMISIESILAKASRI